MRQMQGFKTSRKTFRKSPPHQERRRTEQHHFHQSFLAAVLIPKPFDRNGPLRNLLHFIQYQQGTVPF